MPEFFATVEQVQSGDDEVRLVLHVSDTLTNTAAAVEMIALLNRVLRVRVYLGTADESLAEFPASIPPIKSGLQFRAGKPSVIRLDIPASDRLQAVRLVGHNERVLRFNVADEGQGRAGKTQPASKTIKGEWSHFWAYLHPHGGKGGSGFVTLPGVREAIEEERKTQAEPVWEILHRVFGVGGSTLANTGPDAVLAKFPAEEFPQVALAVERAQRYQAEKEQHAETR